MPARPPTAIAAPVPFAWVVPLAWRASRSGMPAGTELELREGTGEGRYGQSPAFALESDDPATGLERRHGCDPVTVSRQRKLDAPLGGPIARAGEGQLQMRR